ncbi:MAG TPA: hypothetical protein VM938_06965 [Acidimicrobiales bacterium]|nr:hypothetical protein [Acidimicrobiales bacterium]
MLQGSTRATTGIRYGCEGAYCTSFRAAGCPKAMAKANGATTSIVDVSGLGGQTLTFTWRDATKALNRTGANLNSSLNFYVVDSCTQAPRESTYPLGSVLTLTTEHATQTMRIPVGAKWLIAEASYHATAARWSAS